MDVPSQIGPYLVERVLGAGAMGSVFLGRDPRTQAPVAIKVLHEHDPELLARFAREAEAMAKIRDQRVVAAYSAGLHEGAPYLVQEYCAGQDLEQLLKTRGALPPREAAQLVAEIAAGIAAAHAAGVIHRDLKPANVLVERGGRPKVTDFGLAYARRKGPSRHSLTQSGVILGTPAYMAPEQANDAREADAQSDVYALGVILYECLSGRRPFKGGTVFALLQQVLDGEAEPLPEDLPPDLAEIVRCAMAREPADRYSSADILREALEEYLAGRAGSETTGRRLAVGGAIALLVLLTVVALAIASSWGRGVTPPVSQPASTATPIPKPPLGVTPLSSVLPASPSLPPSVAPSLPPPTTPVATGDPAGPLSWAQKPPECGTPEYFRYKVWAWRVPLEELIQAANTDHHPAAMTRLGCDVGGSDRFGPSVDAKAARGLLRRGAKRGDREAMATLSAYLAEGLGGSVDTQEARTLLRKASEAGSPAARYRAAKRRGDPASAARAREHVEAELARGDPAAFFALVSNDVLGDREAVKQWCKAGVALGIPFAYAVRARLNRAQLLPNRVLYAADYKLAAEFKDPEGLCGYSRCLSEALGVPWNPVLANDLLVEVGITGYRGVLIEQIRALWSVPEEERDLPAWRREVLKVSAERLPSYLAGDLGLHVLAVHATFPLGSDPEIHSAGVALLEREAKISLSPLVSYQFGIEVYKGKPPVGGDAPRSSAARKVLAAPYFQRAAEQGHPQGCHAWGHFLLFEAPVPDVSRGLRQLARAAAFGNAASHEHLGDVYSQVRPVDGVKKDLVRAAALYRNAAEAGVGRAMGKLAEFLLAEKKFTEGYTWSSRARAKNDALGGILQAECLIDGRGVRANPEQGIKLMTRVASTKTVTPKRGELVAKANQILADRFQEGRGVAVNLKVAAFYRERAKRIRAGARKAQGQ
ncbi:MAG: protein kinase [Planctomycetes bacterium]|nr:protein kinase [Planctomycetota bacterium]